MQTQPCCRLIPGPLRTKSNRGQYEEDSSGVTGWPGQRWGCRLSSTLTATIWLRMSCRWLRSTFMSLEPDAPASRTNSLFEMWRSFPNLREGQWPHQGDAVQPGVTTDTWIADLKPGCSGDLAEAAPNPLSAGSCHVMLVWGGGQWGGGGGSVCTNQTQYRKPSGPLMQDRWGPCPHLDTGRTEATAEGWGKSRG